MSRRNTEGTAAPSSSALGGKCCERRAVICGTRRRALEAPLCPRLPVACEPPRCPQTINPALVKSHSDLLTLTHYYSSHFNCTMSFLFWLFSIPSLCATNKVTLTRTCVTRDYIYFVLLNLLYTHCYFYLTLHCPTIAVTCSCPAAPHTKAADLEAPFYSYFSVLLIV